MFIFNADLTCFFFTALAYRTSNEGCQCCASKDRSFVKWRQLSELLVWFRSILDERSSILRQDRGRVEFPRTVITLNCITLEQRWITCICHLCQKKSKMIAEGQYWFWFLTVLSFFITGALIRAWKERKVRVYEP